MLTNRYGGDAARLWANGSSGAAVARRFLAFDGVGLKIANMAINILIRDFGIHLTRPMLDIAVDTHVLRVFDLAVALASRDEVWGATYDDCGIPYIHRYLVDRTCAPGPAQNGA